MANIVQQFRYYGDDPQVNVKNYPPGKLKTDFVNGSFLGNCKPITQLGIQSLPGTEFYINNSLEPIIIGMTGIYELELKNQTEITDLSFSAESMERINSNPQSYLIVDILWNKED